MHRRHGPGERFDVRRFPAAILTGLVGAVLPACGDDPAPSSREAPPALVADVGEGGAAFRAAFDEGRGRARIVALVSPT
jgi:hypothetical protein